MRKSESPPTSAWSQIGVPIVQWLALTGLLVMFSLILVGGDHPPQLLRDAAHYPSSDKSPFALRALRERLPNSGIRRVQQYIDYYRKNRRRGLEDALARSTRYLEAFKQIFREAGLPEELSYLPLIESGFMEHAISPANAVGVWQFMEETGRRYDLKTTRWFDQKRDPILSARAAAKFLGHLYEKFHDWELALAAYNAGEGTIYWAVRVNQKAGRPIDFWSLDLPEETANYVPAFLGAMLIAKNPVAYGFHEIEFMPEVVYEHVKVNPGTPLWAVAEELGTDAQTLMELNPELVAGITPPGGRPYALRVPQGAREVVPEKLADLDSNHQDWVLYRVQDEDTVQRLASRFRSSPTTIKKVNRLTSNQELRPGQFVVIPL